MSDYLDKMIEAYDAAWDRFQPNGVKLAKRAAMKAAWDAGMSHQCQEVADKCSITHNAPNNLGLHKLVDGSDTWGTNILPAHYPFNIVAGDGVALMSMAHPTQDLTEEAFLAGAEKILGKPLVESEQERRDRIWAAVQAASGGSY